MIEVRESRQRHRRPTNGGNGGVADPAALDPADTNSNELRPPGINAHRCQRRVAGCIFNAHRMHSVRRSRGRTDVVAHVSPSPRGRHLRPVACRWAPTHPVRSAA